MKRAVNVVPSKEIHMGFYRRGLDEPMAEAIIAPRKLTISAEEIAKEVTQVVETARFVLAQGCIADVTCTVPEVEKRVRKILGADAKRVRFMPPKVESIRGQG